MLLELAMKGSGAATFESFYGSTSSKMENKRDRRDETCRLAFLANHIANQKFNFVMAQLTRSLSQQDLRLDLISLDCS